MGTIDQRRCQAINHINVFLFMVYLTKCRTKIKKHQMHKYISIYSLPDDSEYGLDVSNLLHELNKRASQNPHMIPLLLNMIHENDDSPMST